MRWSTQKKKESIFGNVYFVRQGLLYNLCFISMYRLKYIDLNKLSEYINTFTYHKTIL